MFAFFIMLQCCYLRFVNICFRLCIKGDSATKEVNGATSWGIDGLVRNNLARGTAAVLELVQEKRTFVKALNETRYIPQSAV
jgi:hypothetical protein